MTRIILVIAFSIILALSTSLVEGAEYTTVENVWVEGHWVTVEGQTVWIKGYYKPVQTVQPKQPQVVYVQQPTVIYVQQPAPQVVYVQQPSTFMTFGFSSGFYGGGCYHGHSHNRFYMSGSFSR